MTRGQARADSAAPAPWANKSFSSWMYSRRLSGSTRTFRDPIEVDINNRKRISSSGSNRIPAGATWTFRDATICGLIGTTKTSDGDENEGACRRKSAAATRRRVSSPPTTNGRRASLQEWLDIKTIGSIERTEQLGGGKSQEYPGFNSGDSILGGGKADLGCASPGAFPPTPQDGTRAGGKQSESQGTAVLSTRLTVSNGKSSDNVTRTEDQLLGKDKFANQSKDDAGANNIYEDPVGAGGESRQVAFLSGTMGLTVDIGNPTQPQPPDELLWQQQGTHDDQAQFPASPCSGVILETSPRYGSLQVFRKEMSCRGINGQMFHTGWKRSFLPPRGIRLFLTDSRQASVLYWKYRKNTRGRSGGEKFEAEDRLVIPLSSLANIGLAEVYQQQSSKGAQSRLSSWLSRRRGGDVEEVDCKASKSKEFDSLEKHGQGGRLVEVPVLALSYWVNGKPRWVGDQPKRLLVKPDSLDAFRRLSYGLRLCCLHFHNHSCPQDLEDIR